MDSRDKITNTDRSETKQGRNEESPGVNVEGSPANRKQNPEIGSQGRGPILINDPDATELNRGIFENNHREYYDGDEYR